VTATLSWGDYLVIAAYLSAIVGIGIVTARGRGSLREYFVASGNIPWWAAGVTVAASYISANSYLGGPGWIFARDSRYVLTGSLALVCNGFPGLLEPRDQGINWIWVSGLSLIVSLVVGLATSCLFPPSRGGAAPNAIADRSRP
jgi:hypothetical protein